VIVGSTDGKLGVATKVGAGDELLVDVGGTIMLVLLSVNSGTDNVKLLELEESVEEDVRASAVDKFDGSSELGLGKTVELNPRAVTCPFELADVAFVAGKTVLDRDVEDTEDEMIWREDELGADEDELGGKEDVEGVWELAGELDNVEL
jgi:hypothetical protein